MIIDLSTIESSPRRFDFTLNAGGWQDEMENHQNLVFDEPLGCRVEITRTGIKYILLGSISGSAWVTCDRCLESYRRTLDVEYRLFLSSLIPDYEQKELELSEDDMAIQFVSSNELNLEDIVREQILISLPMKSLCRENCAGLCSVCGTNLNEKKCKCRQSDEGHAGFSKLKTLFVNGEH